MNDYESQILGATPSLDNAGGFSMRMEEFDRQLRQLNKRKKGKKRKGLKKMKKRLRALEREHQQLQMILFAMYQNQMPTVKPQQQPWWQTAVTNSLPKALELAAVSVSRLPPKSQTSIALPKPLGRN